MKPEKVIFVDKKLAEEFEHLSNNDPIKKGIIKAIRDITNDFGAGRLIVKNTHNKQGIKKILETYGRKNLRIYNLPTAWRLIYTVTKTQDIEIIAVILDWMSHKDYEKMLR